MLVDNEKNNLLPSVVHYDETQISTGYDAQKYLLTDPLNTLVSVKRLLGKSLEEINRTYLPYNLSAHESGSVQIETSCGMINAVQASSEILKTLVKRATQNLQGELDGAS
jgi:molecular chaperone HscA